MRFKRKCKVLFSIIATIISINNINAWERGKMRLIMTTMTGVGGSFFAIGPNLEQKFLGLVFIIHGSYTFKDYINDEDDNHKLLTQKHSKVFLNESSELLAAYSNDAGSSMNIDIEDYLSEFQSSDIEQNYTENANELRRVIDLVNTTYEQGKSVRYKEVLLSKYNNRENQDMVLNIILLAERAYAIE